MATNLEYVPSIVDLGFKKQVSTELIYIEQVFDGRILKSFEQLSRELDMPAHDLCKMML